MTLLCITSLPYLAYGRRIASDGPMRPTGPCHSVQTTARHLARGLVYIYSGEPVKGISYITSDAPEPGPAIVYDISLALPISWGIMIRSSDT